MNSITSAVRKVAEPALDPAQMSRGRFRRAYLVDTKYEFLRMIRNPIVSVPLLALPVAMYVFICIILVHTIQLPAGMDIQIAQTTPSPTGWCSA
jgi:hypothetical protein